MSAVLRVLVLAFLFASACTSDSADIAVDADPVATATPAPKSTTAPPVAPTAPPLEPPPSEPPPTAVPTPTETPPIPTEPSEPTETEPACGPDGDDYQFDVVGVAPDDPDGGLITHAGPGVDTPEIGVLAWNSSNFYYVDCEFASNGVAWWLVSAGADLVWVNSNYLGDRRIAADSFAESPCLREESTVFPSGAEAPGDRGVVLADIDVESSADCDRVVIEMAEGFDDFDSIVTALRPDFGAEFIDDITRTDSEIQVKLTQVESFALVVDVESWRDTATDEQNVALVMEDYDTGSTVYVGWGTGDAYLRFAQEPTPRIIIDIFQEPTPENMVVGPIVGGAVLFDPIQTDAAGPGVTLPITLRGWSRGFESSSTLKIATWNQAGDSSPLNWQGELFGADGDNLFDEVEFAVPFQDFGVPYWPFMSSGYFEITITDIAAGAYQLAVEPSSGCFADGGTGQQFRVVDQGEEPGSADYSPALPFSVRFRWVGDDFEQSQTVISVLGVEALGPIEGSPC